MPPPLDELSESENSENGIPFQVEGNAGDDATSEKADDEDVEEFLVEKIIGHRFTKKGELEFDVKWQGWDDPVDRTWEPEENLETAPDSLKDYFDKIGGRPIKEDKPKGKRGPKKRTITEASGSEEPTTSTRKRSGRNVNGDELTVQRKVKYPPLSSDWDPYLLYCETISLEKPNAQGVQVKTALAVWEDGSKQQHALRLMHKHAPQTMLKFYEEHLSFRVVDDPADDQPAAETSTTQPSKAEEEDR